VAARPILGACRMVKGAVHRVAAAVRAAASYAGGALEPVRAVGRRARLASSKLVKSTRATARQLVSQTRHSFRAAVRRSRRRDPDARDAAGGSGHPGG
jgi:hypothetical protein